MAGSVLLLHPHWCGVNPAGQQPESACRLTHWTDLPFKPSCAQAPQPINSSCGRRLLLCALHCSPACRLCIWLHIWWPGGGLPGLAGGLSD